MPRVETAITLEARVMGRQKPEILNQRVAMAPNRPDGSVWRLRDVLAYLVRDEVAAFEQRRQEWRLLRVLSPDQIQQAAAAGKIVTVEFDEAPARGKTDEDVAVAVVLQAFEDGLYFVFLDDGQLENLDAPAPVHDGSKLTFIRLVALAGG